MNKKPCRHAELCGASLVLPEQVCAGARAINQALDRAVDAAYIAAEKAEGRKPPKLTSDAERVAFLFERYQALTSLLPAAKPKRSARRKSKVHAN